MPLNRSNLDNVIEYHKPSDAQVAKIARIRAATKALCSEILDCTPICGDQQAALRCAREAMMTANAAIVLDGAV